MCDAEYTSILFVSAATGAFAFAARAFTGEDILDAVAKQI